MQPWREAQAVPPKTKRVDAARGQVCPPPWVCCVGPESLEYPGQPQRPALPSAAFSSVPPGTLGVPTALITVVTLPSGDTLSCSTVSAQGCGGDETRPSLGELTLGGAGRRVSGEAR